VVAVVTPVGVWLYEADDLQLFRFLPAKEQQNGIAFSPNDQFPVSGMDAGTIQLW
jgi:hypothetical protein